MWGSEPLLQWVDFCGISVLQSLSPHPAVMGFDFTVIVPLLLSHCGFSFIFGCGVSFFVSSSVFLSVIVQQLVVIMVFSQEGVRARPSTPPSWFRAHTDVFLTCLTRMSHDLVGCHDQDVIYIKSWRNSH